VGIEALGAGLSPAEERELIGQTGAPVASSGTNTQRPNRFSGNASNLTPRVLVASLFHRAYKRQPAEIAGENVATTKHGFESRWGHHSEMAGVFAPEFTCRGGRDANPYLRPRYSCRTR
jgi:hypothetical protein